MTGGAQPGAFLLLMGVAVLAWLGGVLVVRGRDQGADEGMRLEAGDCARCITRSPKLPCACDVPCGDTVCLAITLENPCEWCPDVVDITSGVSKAACRCALPCGHPWCGARQRHAERGLA